MLYYMLQLWNKAMRFPFVFCFLGPLLTILQNFTENCQLFIYEYFPVPKELSYYQGESFQIDHSFNPVSFIPWMKVFCAKKKAMMIGTVNTTDAAIRRFQATVR